MSAAAPDALDRFGLELGERVNPIVVKEVRQGLRTRTFWIFFALMLLACLVIALVAFAASDGGADKTGFGTFVAVFVALSLVQFFVIPYTAYRSMAREREEETWVLLTLTGLGPRRILAGKIGSFIAQGLLYASAAAPFLLFSYYLNGIDLPTILVAVVIAAGYQIFLVAVGVSVATLAESRIVRALLHFALLGGLFLALTAGISSSVGVAEEMRRLAGDDAFWVAAFSVLFALVTTGLLLFEAAAARLSLPTESYARGPRLLLVVQALGMAGLFALAFVVSHEVEALVIGAGLISLYVAVAGTFFGADRDGMARNHWARAGRFHLLRPGALRGYVLLVLVLAVGVGGLVALAMSRGGVALTDDKLVVMLTAPGLAVLYLSAPNVVARWIPHPPWQTAALVRILFIGLVVFGSGVPPLIGQIVLERPNDDALNALSPVMAMVNASEHGVTPALLLLWGVAVGVAFWTYFVLRARDAETHA